MKKILLLLLVACSQLTGFEAQAQTFFETQFMSGGMMYDALVVYYDDNDLLVRTRYKKGEDYIVAEWQATAQIVNYDDGTSCYLIDGEDAEIVYGPTAGGYSADNYIFYPDENDEWATPYALDDNGWQSDDPTEHMIETNFWRQVDPAEKFTEDYVFNYFERDEPMYKVLLAYNPNNIIDVAGVNGSGAAAGGGEWKVFMSQGTGYGQQSWVTHYDFPKDKIREYWADGKAITDVSYGNGLWMVNMTKDVGYGRQSYKNGAAWPNEWIETKWGADQHITEVAYGNGQWAVVTSTQTGYSGQIYSVSKAWPKDWLNTNWRDGEYSITSIAYGAGHWAVVLSKTPGENPGQRLRAGEDFPADDIVECWGEDYDVTSMAYGDEWVVVLTKGLNLVQTYDEGTAFPKDFVKTKWGEEYLISEAIYTYKEQESHMVLNFTGTASTTGVSNNTIVHQPATTNNNSNPTPNSTAVAAVPRLHLITVANTKVPDIGTSCVIDRDNILDEFNDITSGLGIELKKHTVDGENLSKANVKSAIARLDVRPNDIVVFAYSGHGYRWSDQVSKYPMLALFYSRYDSPSNSNSYDLKEVYDMIVAKGGRLNIVLGDCCNNDIGVTSRDGGGGLASRSFTQGSTDRLRALFFEARGNIIAGAAQAGETACGSSGSGGYFLNAFFSGIDKEVSYTATGDPSWSKIMSRAMSSATYKTQNLNGCDAQHGVYKSSVVH
jgi:hypothetical protein